MPNDNLRILWKEGVGTAIADPEERLPKPDKPCETCEACGSTDWHWMTGNFGSGWRCGKCHPPARRQEQIREC